MTVTEPAHTAAPETEKSESRFSLLKLAFSTPFAILMLGLSMLSFLKRQDLLSLKGFLDSLVEIFHGVTFSITQWVIWVIDWMLPWWELEIYDKGSDVLWITIVAVIPGMQHIMRVVSRAFGAYKTGEVLAFLITILWISFAIEILFTPTNSHIINNKLFNYLMLTVAINYANFIICLDGNFGEDMRQHAISYYRNTVSTALIILSLYFAGFIELVSKTG